MKRIIIGVLLFNSLAGLAHAKLPSLVISPTLDVSKGNTEHVTAGISTDLGWRKENDLHYELLKTDYNYAETDKGKNANNGSLRFDYGYNFFSPGNSLFKGHTFIKYLNIFFFSQPSFDEQQKLDLRWHTGAGPKWYFLRVESSSSSVEDKWIWEKEVSLSAAILYEREEKSEGLGRADFTRLSVRPKINFPLWETPSSGATSLSLVYFYMPRLDRWNDYRMSAEGTLKVPIYRKIIFINFTLKDDYNAVVPNGVIQNTFSFINTVTIKLK